MIKTVCFTGHRNLRNDSQIISDFLYNILDRLISEKGITDYYSGGAVGFDTIAAFCVIKLKEKYPQVKLHLVLPCSFSTQTVNWSSEQIENYNLIIGLADSIEYISKQYYDGCMKARNARLIEYATDYCISYWNDNDNRSGTGQTVRMAQRKGLPIINIFKYLSDSNKTNSDYLTNQGDDCIIESSKRLEESHMPRKKKSDAEIVSDVKVEAKGEKDNKIAVKDPVKKPSQNPVAKRASAKASSSVKTTTKSSKTTDEIKETVKVQYGANEYDLANIKKTVESECYSKFNGKIKSIDIYIKPEDSAVYYVINSEYSGKVDL